MGSRDVARTKGCQAVCVLGDSCTAPIDRGKVRKTAAEKQLQQSAKKATYARGESLKIASENSESFSHPRRGAQLEALSPAAARPGVNQLGRQARAGPLRGRGAGPPGAAAAAPEARLRDTRKIAPDNWCSGHVTAGGKATLGAHCVLTYPASDSRRSGLRAPGIVLTRAGRCVTQPGRASTTARLGQ